MVSAIADAIDYAHGNGLLHRDIKPSNVLVSQPKAGKRRVLLADFGIARRLDDISGLTATNMTVGTVNYAAPEQLMGHAVDARTDQYALAATAYHWLTGTAPFAHSNPAVVISHHLTAAPPRLSAMHPDLTPLDDVLVKALAKEPGDRFRDCTDFATALIEAAGGKTNVHSSPTAVAVNRPIADRKQAAGQANLLRQQAEVADTAANGSPTPMAAGRTKKIVPGALAALLVVALAALVVFLMNGNKSEPSMSATPSTTMSSRAPALVPTVVQGPTSAPAPPPPVPAPTTSQAPATLYALPACYSVADPPTERPSSVLILYCADGGAQLNTLTRTSWGPDDADGKGYFAVKSCEPSCAQGGLVQFPAIIHAANPVPLDTKAGCPPNTAIYSDLILAFPTAAVPNGINGQTVNTTYQGLPAIQFTTNQNQTNAVSLGSTTCW